MHLFFFHVSLLGNLATYLASYFRRQQGGGDEIVDPQWVFSAFFVAFSVAIVLSGYLANAIGTRVTIIIAMFIHRCSVGHTCNSTISLFSTFFLSNLFFVPLIFGSPLLFVSFFPSFSHLFCFFLFIYYLPLYCQSVGFFCLFGFFFCNFVKLLH